MALAEGRVTEKLEALVKVRFVVGREVECLVDTGASCALVLPASLVDELGLPIIGYEDDLGMVGGDRTTLISLSPRFSGSAKCDLPKWSLRTTS